MRARPPTIAAWRHGAPSWLEGVERLRERTARAVRFSLREAGALH
jgi:hypothetical protein